MLSKQNNNTWNNKVFFICDLSCLNKWSKTTKLEVRKWFYFEFFWRKFWRPVEWICSIYRQTRHLESLSFESVFLLCSCHLTYALCNERKHEFIIATFSRNVNAWHNANNINICYFYLKFKDNKQIWTWNHPPCPMLTN